MASSEVGSEKRLLRSCILGGTNLLEPLHDIYARELADIFREELGFVEAKRLRVLVRVDVRWLIHLEGRAEATVWSVESLANSGRRLGPGRSECVSTRIEPLFRR